MTHCGASSDTIISSIPKNTTEFMKAEKQPTLNVLMLHHSQNEAEPLLNELRNRGQATRSHFVASLDELEKVSQEQGFDLACIHLGAENVDPTAAFEHLNQQSRDLPLIGLTDELSQQDVEHGLALGAEDVVCQVSTDHFVHSVLRSYQQLLVRRRRRQLEQMLTESERRCQLLLDGSRDAIAYVHEGMHIYANEAYRELFGYDDMEELFSMPIMDLLRTEPPDELKAQLKKVSTGEKAIFEAVGKHESGETFDARLDISQASYEGEACIQIVIRKLAVDADALQAKVREMASYDVHTNLHNRAYFDERLIEVTGAVARGGSEHTLTFIQLANFNDIKDSVGIAGADLLLADVAEILRDTYDEAVVVARFLDDVFTVICDTPLTDARQRSEQMLKRITDHLFEVNNQTIQVALHAGLCSINETSGTGTQIITQAHEACMLAIREKAPLRIWEPGASSAEENTITKQLREALEHDKLRVLFQPILNLRQGSEENYEVLVRMQGESDQLIEPQQFLDAADVADLAGEMDRWVFQRAVTELARHRRDRGASTRVFIHLTAASVQDPTFLPWANKVLRQARLPGDAVIFQISERVAQNYLKMVKAFSKGLNVLHSGLAIGRFGHAEQHDVLFKHLSVDFVKVDPDFARDLDRTANQERLTELLSRIHETDAASIVPHIESAAILGNLWQLGVRYVQGYYLQAPAESMSFQFEDDE